MEAGEEKGGGESGFFFLIFKDIEKMGWDTKQAEQASIRATAKETGFLRIEHGIANGSILYL